MAPVTRKGDELSSRLNLWIGTTYKIRETCSLIARHATTYAWMQEVWCTREMSDWQTADLKKREGRIERRLNELATDLPETGDGPFKLQLDGDPRGYVVRLVAPDGREIEVA